MQQAKRGKLLQTALGGVLLSLMTLFLTITEGSLKSVLQAIFHVGDCVIIFDIHDATQTTPHSLVNVQLFSTGITPRRLPVTFKSSTQKLLKVEFEKKPLGGNYGYHPDAGSDCPGGSPKDKEICPSHSQKEITFLLDPFDKAFSYSFRVRLDEGTSERDISLYVQYQDDKEPYCRIERAGLVNLLLRLNPTWKFFVLVIVFLLLAFGITLLRQEGRDA